MSEIVDRWAIALNGLRAGGMMACRGWRAGGRHEHAERYAQVDCGTDDRSDRTARDGRRVRCWLATRQALVSHQATILSRLAVGQEGECLTADERTYHRVSEQAVMY